MADDKKPKRLGAYAKLSATYYRDDAVLRAGEAAELLFARGLAFCAESPGNGYITDMQVTHVIGIGLRKRDDRVKALVREGLWEKVDGGYVVRSWLKWNRSAEQMSMDRKNDRERKARQAKVDAERNPDGNEPESDRNPEALTPDSLSETKTRTRTGQGQDIDTDRTVPTTSGAVAKRDTGIHDDHEGNLGQVVAAYVEGAKSAGLPTPSERLRGKVGKDARRLAANTPVSALIVAARSMGSRGWDDLDRELQRVGADAKKPATSTADARAMGGLELAHRLAGGTT